MLTVGAASVVINNEIGREIQGATVHQKARFVRDDLEANALYLTDQDHAVMLVSCDLGVLTSDFVFPTRQAMGQAAGIDPRTIIIAGTHTHSGPSVLASNRVKPVDTAYLNELRSRLVDLAKRTVDAARPAKIGYALGSAQVGYNRRCCWADGSHTMHGDTAREDFTGLEGPDDPRQFMLAVKDGDDKIMAVFHNNTSHPTSFYGADFYSADFPGQARSYLREVFGDIPVLFFNGAFGDISIDNQLTNPLNSEGREQKMLRAAHLMAGETLRLIHDAEFRDDLRLGHVYEDIAMPVRLPAPERLAWAGETLGRIDAGGEVPTWDDLFAFGIQSLQDAFGDDPVDTVPVHAIRIGDAAIVTQPCELYCQFGIDIKRRSPSPVTAVCGVADGYCGYCPTSAGILGGGYSGEPIYWTRLAVEAGDVIVNTAAKLVHQLWKR